MSDQQNWIESTYDLSQVKVNGEFVWPILRSIYINNISSIYSIKKSSYSFIRYSIRSFLYGFLSLFKKYEVICFSGSGMGIRRFIGGKYKNRFIDPIIDIIGQDKVLLVERPVPIHFPKNITYTKNVVSERFIDLMIIIVSYLLPNFRIENCYILEEIKQKYGLVIDDHYLIRIYQAEKIIYKFIFRLYKPRCIFLTQYYNREGRIKAAKELNIPIIEVQHGYIGSKHPEYNHNVMSSGCYPDYLLAFGEYKTLSNSNCFIYKEEQVYSIGSYYIDYIKDMGSRNKPKNFLDKRFKVAVTLQSTVEIETVEFIVNSAKMDSEILYFLLPRSKKYDFGMALPDNIIIINEISFYQMMFYVDYHSTVYSTCAIEAPSLGVQNILINIKNLSKEYYQNLLTDKKITKYVENPEEYVETIKNFNKLEKRIIIESNKHIFSNNYRRNLHNSLKKIGLIF